MPNEIKRHFYKNKDYVIDYDNKKLHLLPDFHSKLLNGNLWGRFSFKKIGGSSIGDVLEVDKYKSPFLAFCRLSWISQPILDRKYVDAGIAIEPKVVSLIEEVTGKHVETYDPKKYNFDYFADKDEVLGGLPDGFIQSTDTVIEIKTTGEKNLDKWNKFGIPQGYLRQAQLYSYLMDAQNYSIVATFLKEDDYINPSKYPIKERVTKNWNFKINREQVHDDIAYVKKWYANVTISGESPEFDEQRDAELLEWLECETPEDWEALKDKWIASGKLVI